MNYCNPSVVVGATNNKQLQTRFVDRYNQMIDNLITEVNMEIDLLQNHRNQNDKLDVIQHRLDSLIYVFDQMHLYCQFVVSHVVNIDSKVQKYVDVEGQILICRNIISGLSDSLVTDSRMMRLCHQVNSKIIVESIEDSFNVVVDTLKHLKVQNG